MTNCEWCGQQLWLKPPNKNSFRYIRWSSPPQKKTSRRRTPSKGWLEEELLRSLLRMWEIARCGEDKCLFQSDGIWVFLLMFGCFMENKLRSFNMDFHTWDVFLENKSSDVDLFNISSFIIRRPQRMKVLQFHWAFDFASSSMTCFVGGNTGKLSTETGWNGKDRIELCFLIVLSAAYKPGCDPGTPKQTSLANSLFSWRSARDVKHFFLTEDPQKQYKKKFQPPGSEWRNELAWLVSG